jgi:hypothetical protein
MSEVIKMLQCLLMGSKLVIIRVFIYAVVYEHKLFVHVKLIVVEHLSELLSILALEAFLCFLFASLSLLISFLIHLKPCEAKDYVREELISKHLLEELQSVLKLLTEPWILRVQSNEECMHKA